MRNCEASSNFNISGIIVFPKCFSGGDATPEQGGSSPGASRLAQECLSEHAGKWLSATFDAAGNVLIP